MIGRHGAGAQNLDKERPAARRTSFSMKDLGERLLSRRRAFRSSAMFSAEPAQQVQRGVSAKKSAGRRLSWLEEEEAAETARGTKARNGGGARARPSCNTPLLCCRTADCDDVRFVSAFLILHRACHRGVISSSSLTPSSSSSPFSSAVVLVKNTNPVRVVLHPLQPQDAASSKRSRISTPLVLNG